MSQPMKHRLYTGRALQQGLSLIELMVALLITAIIFAGVINTLLASKRAYLFDDEIAYIQENSRFALDFLAREVREAGYTGGCNINTADVANALRPDVDQSDIYDTTPIEGFEGGVSVFPASFSAGVTAGTDAFIIRKASSDGALTVTNHVGPSAIIHVSPSHSYSDGTVLMMVNADCSKVGVFSATSTQTDQIQHQRGNGTSENCSQRLSGDFDCTGCPNSGQCSGSSTDEYQDGSSVFQLSAQAFYIGTSAYNPNVRSLYVRSLNDGGSVNSSELVSGVEDMQILYGIDNEPTNPDGEANRYYTADAILQDNADATTTVAWDRVVSARITLVMRSRNEVLSEAGSVTMPTTGTTYNDRYLYQEVSTVINLRNAALPANPVN